MAELQKMRWYRSIAVKSIVVAFIATHVPLLALVALVVLAPNWLSPAGVLIAALGATLMAAVLVTLILYRLFRPLQVAADGLRRFMTTGRPMRLMPGTGDEVGRLVQVLVMALSHIDRGREPLLSAGGWALKETTGSSDHGGVDVRAYVLLEVDRWHDLEIGGDVIRMQEVQSSVNRLLNTTLKPGETVLPWGRGRFLLTMQGAVTEATSRLKHISRNIRSSGGPGSYSFSAVVEACGHNDSSVPAMLHSLEQKLFVLRLEGGAGQIV